MKRSRRLIAAIAIATLAFSSSIIVASSASAAPAELQDIAFTDGTLDGTGDEISFDSGTTVGLVINEMTTGSFSFTGCWAVVVDGDFGNPIGMPAVTALTTWVAGTAIDTLFPEIDLTPETSTSYDLFVFGASEDEAGIDCASLYQGPNLYTSASMFIEVQADAESMTLTGSAILGSTVTAAAKIPGSLVGNDFDLWVCPDTTIRPDDGAADGANGDCVGPFVQGRTGDSTSFHLGYDPERDGTGDDAAFSIEFWNAACDQYFVVHDYPNGGHSNWVGPIDCDTAATAELAETGVDELTTMIALGALGAMLLGGVLFVTRRRQEVRTE